MVSETTYRVDKNDLDAFMRDYGSEMVFAWLAGERISSQTACDILKICPKTMTNWINDGRMVVLNEGKRSHEFDLSDIVRLRLLKKNKLKVA